jgi:gliding motility-associated-like protein
LQTILSIAFVFLISALCGQSVTLQQVMGSFGQMNSERADVAISATAGESVVSTESSSSYILTQGFHQPGAKGLLDFDVLTADASCPTSTDGSAWVKNISGCSPPYAVQWSFGASGVASGRLAPGTYSVTITSGGCTVSKDFIIGSGPESECALVFFKAFSPNGDGTNDSWEIENIHRPEFSDNNIEIFNRWGQTVWSASGYNNTDVVWSGKTEKGIDLPLGTYFYVARVADVIYKGFIELTK